MFENRHKLMNERNKALQWFLRLMLCSLLISLMCTRAFPPQNQIAGDHQKPDFLPDLNNNEETAPPNFINFFPIKLGNKWIYNTWHREYGVYPPTIDIVSEEIVEIIEHQPPSNAFTLQITVRNSTKAIKTDAGDTTLFLPEQTDTLKMAMNDTALVIVSSTLAPFQEREPIPIFERVANYAYKTVLPDSAETYDLGRIWAMGDARTGYTITQGIGFMRFYSSQSMVTRTRYEEATLRVFYSAGDSLFTSVRTNRKP